MVGDRESLVAGFLLQTTMGQSPIKGCRHGKVCLAWLDLAKRRINIGYPHFLSHYHSRHFGGVHLMYFYWGRATSVIGQRVAGGVPGKWSKFTREGLVSK